MQKYILSLFALMLTLGSASAIANVPEPASTQSAMKVATIAKMYQQDVDNQGQDYPVVLEQYGNKELQAAMQLERDYFDKEEFSCHIGYDVLWDSQDSDYEQDKKFAITEQGLVKVSLAQGSDIYYELTCDSIDNKVVCQVADVILDSDGSSLKQYLDENCR